MRLVVVVVVAVFFFFCQGQILDVEFGWQKFERESEIQIFLLR